METLDPLTRGAIIHEIQFSVLSLLHDAKAYRSLPTASNSPSVRSMPP